MTATMRHRLTGLAALAGLLGIVAGLPAVLLALGATPIPHSLPTWSTLRQLLTSPDDGTLALTAIKVLAWALWVFLTGLILLEVAARLRGARAPHLAGLTLPQSTARSLVGAAALLFMAAPLTAQTATAAPQPVAVVATGVPGQTAPTTPPTAAVSPSTALSTPSPTPVVTHTVRHGETLWSIAADHLGTGTRYREIVALNPQLLPDGGDFIKAGWILTLPAPTPPAATDQTYTVQRGDTLSGIAERTLGDATRYPQILAASTGITQPGGAHLSDPDIIDVGWTLNLPAHPAAPPAAEPEPPGPSAAPAAPTPPPPAPASPSPTPVTPPPAVGDSTPTPAPADTTTSDAPEADIPWPVRTGFGVGSVLAAGVVALLGARRTTQQRRRRPGQRLPMPDGPAATVEHELRTTADVLSVESVNQALRTLARDCATTSSPLPVVRAARLTADQFDLYLAHPASLPAPWTGTTDTTVWTLQRANLTDLADIDVSDIPAPYPALVTIGHDDEGGHVLLDLEHLGALDITGDPQHTREVLTAIAVELATSIWADDLQVTIVGGCPELEDALQTGRIRYLPSVGRILDDLTDRAARDQAALHAAGAPDLHHARVTAAAVDAWAPEIVLLAGPVTPRQRNQLEALVDQLPQVAIAIVTAGAKVGEWALDLTAGDDPSQAVLSPLGLQLQPQRIPSEQYAHILELAALTDLDNLTDPDRAVPTEPTLDDITGIETVDEPTPTPVETTAPAPEPPDLTPPMVLTEPPSPDDAAASPEPAPAVPDAEEVAESGPGDVDVAAGPVESPSAEI